MVVAAVSGGVTSAQPSDDGIDWVTIGAPGNRPWDRGEVIQGTVNGRGGVNYEYRIGRTEITTAQWMEFINTFSARADAPASIGLPDNWGAVVDPMYGGPGVRYRLSTAYSEPGLHTVDGITWREAAMYCNWLHNDKSSDLTAIASGAYDTSTFGYDTSTFGYDNRGFFTDQRTRSAGARYWIPSFDEWMKAVHYDAASDYWFLFPNGTDQPSIGGPPGVGTVNIGIFWPVSQSRHVPVGSYPQTLSPWGLLDTSGSTFEFTEGITDYLTSDRFRITKGGAYGSDPLEDSGLGFGGIYPDVNSLGFGFRIASAVPFQSPPGCAKADYDGSGGVDGWDIDPFIRDWQAGVPRADIDESGGIDGDDISAFFHWWERGGCGG